MLCCEFSQVAMGRARADVSSLLRQAHAPDGTLAGAIVGKAEPRSADRTNPFGDMRTRGYVAMLAVEQSNRRTGLGAALVTVLLHARAKICHEVRS